MSRGRRFCTGMVAAALAGLWAATPAAADEKIGGVSQPLSVATATVWVGPISVCWMFDGRDTEKVAVKQAIANTWEAQSAVRIVGWTSCKVQPGALRINIADETANPHTVALGKNLSGRSPGMVLNFDFKNWSTGCAKDEATRMSCIRSIGVHEFGHALGFAHEQNRADAACEVDVQGSNGNENVGVADLSSIMNYCNPKWNNNGQLSATDIQGVRQFYGAPAGALVPLPKGTYQNTCTKLTADNQAVYATCRGKNEVYWSTQLTNYQACSGDIANRDGRLACASRPLPGGSYQATCRDMLVDNGVLAGSCRDKGGTYRRTQLAGYSACTGPISNENGQLSCTKGQAPTGSYTSTCHDINAKGGVLYADCRSKGGADRHTWLKYALCSGDIHNEDGLLRCQNGLGVPAGSYAKSCDNRFNNGGELSALCRTKSGSWNPSNLTDVVGCKDISNNNGALVCIR